MAPGADELLRPTGLFEVDVLLDRIDAHVRKACRSLDLWRHYRREIPKAALMVATHHWNADALTDQQAKVWGAIDSAITSYRRGIITLSGPRGIAKSAGAARWAMNRPGRVRWLRASEAGRISLQDSGAWQELHDSLCASSARVVIDDLGTFNATGPVSIARLGDLICSLHEAEVEVCIASNFGRTAIEEIYDDASGGQGRLIDRLIGHGSTFVDLWDIAEGVPSFREHEHKEAPSKVAQDALELVKEVYAMAHSGDVGRVLGLLAIDRASFEEDVARQAKMRERINGVVAALADSMRAVVIDE